MRWRRQQRTRLDRRANARELRQRTNGHTTRRNAVSLVATAAAGLTSIVAAAAVACPPEGSLAHNGRAAQAAELWPPPLSSRRATRPSSNRVDSRARSAQAIENAHCANLRQSPRSGPDQDSTSKSAAAGRPSRLEGAHDDSALIGPFIYMAALAKAGPARLGCRTPASRQP